MYLHRQACKVNLSFIRVTGKAGVVLGDGGGGGDGGGYLAEVEVHGEDEHGELGGGGYLCRVTGNFVSFSLSVIRSVSLGDGGGGGVGSESLFVREAAVDNCPERVDAADVEVAAVEAAVLKMRRVFWCTRKEIQDKTLFLLYFVPESLFVRVCRIN